MEKMYKVLIHLVRVYALGVLFLVVLAWLLPSCTSKSEVRSNRMVTAKVRSFVTSVKAIEQVDSLYSIGDTVYNRGRLIIILEKY